MTMYRTTLAAFAVLLVVVGTASAVPDVAASAPGWDMRAGAYLRDMPLMDDDQPLLDEGEFQTALALHMREKNPASYLWNKAKAGYNYVGNKVDEAKENVSNYVDKKVDDASKAFTSAKESAKETIQETSEAVNDRIDQAADAINDAHEDLKEKADDVRTSIRQTATDLHSNVIAPLTKAVNDFVQSSPSGLRLLTCIKDALKANRQNAMLPTNIFTTLAGGMPLIAPRVLNYIRRMFVSLLAKLQRFLNQKPKTLKDALNRQWTQFTQLTPRKVRAHLIVELRKLRNSDRLAGCILPFIESHISYIANGLTQAFQSIKKILADNIAEIGGKAVGVTAMIAIDAVAQKFQDTWAVHYMRSQVTEELLQVPRQQEIANLLEEVTKHPARSSAYDSAATAAILKMNEQYQIDSRVIIRVATPAVRITLGKIAEGITAKYFPIMYNRIMLLLGPTIIAIIEWIEEEVCALGDVFSEWICSGIGKIVNFVYSILAIESMTAIAKKATRVVVNLLTNFVFQPAALAANGEGEDAFTARLVRSLTSKMDPASKERLSAGVRHVLTGFAEGYVKPLLESLRKQNDAVGKIIRAQMTPSGRSALEAQAQAAPAATGALDGADNGQQAEDDKPFNP